MTGFDHPSIAFDRPCYRPSIAPAIAYSIDLLSTSIDPTSIAPIPPERSNRSLGLGGPARLRPQEGEKGKGQNCPRHRHASVDIEQPALPATVSQCHPRSAARVSQRVFLLAWYRRPLNNRTNPRPSYGLCAGPIFPCASQPAGRRVCPSHNPLCRNETHRCHHLSKDQKDIYARVSNHVFHSVEAVGRAREAQAIGAAEALAMVQSRYSNGAGKRGPAGLGVGATWLAHRIIDLFLQHRAAFFKNLGLSKSGRPFAGKVGPLRKLAAAGPKNLGADHE